MNPKKTKASQMQNSLVDHAMPFK